MKLYPDDWQVRLITGVVSAACIVAAMMLFGNSFWPFMLSLVVAIIVGNLLGPLACRLLLRSSSGGPLEKETKDEKK